MKLGVNVVEPWFWHPAWVFRNAINQASQWSDPNNSNNEIKTDANGWPLLNAGQQAQINIYFNLSGNQAPGGVYNVTWTGNGTVVAKGDATMLANPAPTANSFSFNYVPQALGIVLQITASDPSNPVKQITVFPAANITGSFRPEYMGGFGPYPGPVRMMPWSGVTNYPANCTLSWPNRQTLSYYSQGRNVTYILDANGNRVINPATGYPEVSGGYTALEWQIILCSELGVDGWFNIPHCADDNYVQQMAETIESMLSPGLCAYIEYSNEVWNYGYPASTYAVEVGQKINPNGNTLNLGKASEIKRTYSIFDQVFGVQNAGTRYKRVLADQIENPGRFQQMMLTLQAAGYTGIDVMAGAPYAYLPNTTLATYTASTTVAQILSDTSNFFANTIVPTMQSLQQTINTWSSNLGRPIEHAAYEWGNELIPGQGQPYTQAFYNAQSDPGMKTLYQQCMNGMQAAGVTVACYNDDIFPDNANGCYGARNYQLDPWTSPKASALAGWVNT